MTLASKCEFSTAYWFWPEFLFQKTGQLSSFCMCSNEDIVADIVAAVIFFVAPSSQEAC